MARSANRYGQTGRRNVLIAILGLCALGLIARLVWLQVYQNKFLVDQGDNRVMRMQTEDALRGMIMDREGEPLAISTPVSSVVADPKVLWATLEGDFEREREACLSDSSYSEYCAWVNDPLIDSEITLMRYQQTRLEPLAELLEVPVAELMDDLRERANRRFYYLRRQLPPQRMSQIIDLKIQGIRREDGYQRFYPSGELVGQIIGFTGIDEQGQEGIESQYNDWLSGQSGKIRVLQDKSHNAIQVVDEEVPLAPGSPLQLSIDKRIQFVMHRELRATMDEFKAKSVAGVMVDVKSGEILAMVSLPDGNPNNPAERIPELMKNHIITDTFEPGSTIKPIAMAAALDAGVVTPHTTFKTHGYMGIGRNVVRDTHNYGTMDSVGVIRKSSNVGMAMISQRLPRAKYYEFLGRMGFGKPSGVKFPGEQVGIVRNPEKMGDFSYATTFFGYGISVTALQIAHAYATIANDGVKVPLTLIKRRNPEPGVRVLSQSVADNVLSMMEAAVGKGGSGTRANTEYYTVAGKTGTSHKITNGKYDKKRYRGLFAGIAPVSDPRIALVVVVDDPQSQSYYGGLVAAPAFSRITEWSLKILGVLPDKISKSEDVVLHIDPEVYLDNSAQEVMDETAQ